MKIVLVTDAWFPQVNGVVTTLNQTATQLRHMGHEVRMVTSEGRASIPCPTYPEIRLTLSPKRRIGRTLRAFLPDAVHIATEGPLGLAARNWCRQQGWIFTTSFHTRFPEYVAARFPVPVSWGYAYMRWFHQAADHIMVSNAALAQELRERGLGRLCLWPRGVDGELFRPLPEEERFAYLPGPRPAFVNFGRVAVEKNVEAFLSLDLPGSKYVIGEGPLRADLQKRYPEVNFLGLMRGETLARHLASADVMVFPSRTDTLGLVLYEANACGVPVAAYPVMGPQTVVENGINGYLDEDLGKAALAALSVSRNACRTAALAHDWRRCTEIFASLLVPARPDSVNAFPQQDVV
ncbi:MAG: glycosyltransferase family 1 protein [Acidithiobacillus sp.]|jgi:glycosyltransferase involved in cell wall biosynthesis|nr:glycosyltransferase family 1 protein [Acidithiobacillus sp.]